MKEERNELKDKWKKIYRQKENNIGLIWNEEEMKLYRDSNRNIKITRYQDGPAILGQPPKIDEKKSYYFPDVLSEHMDMEFKFERKIEMMKECEITREDLIKAIQKVKNNKSPGPDGIRGEIWREISKRENILEKLKILCNKVLNTDEVPKCWLVSKTKMIKKIKKPTATDLRPIALTNQSYKIFMTIIKEKIENHILSNNAKNELQTGFTKCSRVEDNLYVLKYCKKESARRNSMLAILSIDFKKAFDSIDRGMLIETMKKFGIAHNIIDIIARVYSSDLTYIHLREDLVEKMEISNGIRQGCTGSSVLFKLVTYMIINEIQKKCYGFQNEQFKINCSLFADDSLILEENMMRLARTLKLTTEISAKYGLELNKDKSKIMILNGKTEQIEMEGVQIVNELKYLGFLINNKRNIFSKHKINNLKKAQKMCNMTYSVLERSVNKLLIGKTYWKQIIIPSILYGSGIIDFTKDELNKLQAIENSVYRKILGAPKYTPVECLRGDVGASSVVSRDIRTKLNYYKYIKTGNNKLLKDILTDMEEKNYEIVKSYENMMKLLRITNIYEENIKDKMIEYDNECWKSGMSSKNSIEMYRIYKDKIKEENIYENSKKSELWFKLRSNTINLNIRKRFENKSTICELCMIEEETLQHFILKCPKLQGIRNNCIEIQWPINEKIDETIGMFIFSNENLQIKMKTIESMWKKRNEMMKS